MKTIFLQARLTATFLLILGCFLANAQVVINEFSAANYDEDLDNFGEYEDWIELYNTSSAPFDLSGYHLSDKMGNTDKWEFPNGISIPGNGFLVIYASGKDIWVGLSLHTSFKITQTKGSEAVVFSDPDGTIIDFNEIDLSNKKNHSWGKKVDGGTEWGVLPNPTPGGPNLNIFDGYASRANISPDAGYYASPVTVELASPEPDVLIYYTLDGSTPTTGSTLYSGPFQLSSTTVVKSIAISTISQILPSFVDYHTFFVGQDQHSIPVVSISGNNNLNSLMNGSQGDPQGNFELFDADQSRVADATGEFNKHGNDSWAYDQRGIDYITRDQFGDDYAIKHQIFPEYTERSKFQRLILKAAANDNYPFQNGSAHIRDAYVHALSQKAGLEMDERTYEPCILYVNGEYWGVYEIREKVDDHDFTSYYYDQDKEWIDFIKTWGGTWSEYGSDNDWEDLVDFILSNDMTDADNYAYVESELNVLSLIDYMILHSHNVSSDWLNWNTAWWRGRDPNGGAKKWRYALWDEDATFGHYINYTNVPDQTPDADPCNPELLGNPGGQGHIPMLNTLLENEDFFQLYINRYADLNNLYFNCDFMLGFLDELIGRINPEMPRQIERWGGTMAEWESNVQELRDFIQTRCTVIDNAIVDCYEDEGISGPYEIIINVAPDASGNVKANTTIGINYPWATTYFGGIGIDLEAIPEEDWEFDHWEVANNIFSPDQFSEAISMSIESGDVITAYFLPLPCAGVNNDPSIQGSLVFCNGDNTSLIAASGFSSYLWSNNSTNQSISLSEGGIIGITVTDATGCPGFDEVVVTALPELETEQSPTICTGNSYQVGTSVYTQPGEYTDIIPSFNGCDSTVHTNLDVVDEVITSEQKTICYGEVFNGTSYFQSTIVPFTGVSQFDCDSTHNVNLTVLAEINLDVSVSGECSVGPKNILANANGGSGNFSYTWSNGPNTAGQEDVPSGTYTVTVTDQNSCSSVQTVEVDDSEGVSIDYDIEHISCAGQSNGSIDLTILTGQPPFDINWVDNGNNEDINNLAAGSYTLLITDANDCSIATAIQVGEPDPLSINISSTPSNGTNNGTATAIVTGGTTPFTYSWSNGGNSAYIQNLAVGVYTVEVIDANGCSSTQTVDISVATAVQEIDGLLSLELFPNPSSGIFNVNVDFAEAREAGIFISNAVGQIVKRYPVVRDNQLRYQVDISEVPSGTYFLVLEVDNQKTARRFVITK